MKRPDDGGWFYRVDDAVYAGRYPGAPVEAVARAKLHELLGLGVKLFVDLTEPGEITQFGPLAPYSEWLPREVKYLTLPTRDVTCPSLSTIDQALAAIHGLQEGNKAYVHCLGGCGRTGVVIGCYLVSKGRDGETALAEVGQLTGTAFGGKVCPETAGQRRMVRCTFSER